MGGGGHTKYDTYFFFQTACLLNKQKKSGFVFAVNFWNFQDIKFVLFLAFENISYEQVQNRRHWIHPRFYGQCACVVLRLISWLSLLRALFHFFNLPKTIPLLWQIAEVSCHLDQWFFYYRDLLSRLKKKKVSVEWYASQQFFELLMPNVYVYAFILNSNFPFLF